MERALFTVNEAAHYLGISPRNLREKIKLGEISTIRIGRLVKIHKNDLDAYIESLKKMALGE